MRYISIFIRSVSRLNDCLGKWIVSYLALAMFLILIFEVIARYLFSSPTIWAMELTQMLFGAYIMLSGGYLLVQRGHINVDIFYSRLPPRARAATDIATSFLLFLFMLVLLKEGWALATDAVARMETSHSAWNPPLWPLKLMIPTGALLLLLQGLARLLSDVAILLGIKLDLAHADAEEEKEH